MSVQTSCPGCGADLVFTTGAPLRVCDHCRSVVARRDRDLDNLGKVVDLVVTRSPLELWLKGAWRGAGFTLVGRAQLVHPQGGVWDEWYAAFDDGRWGWLAEAQGKLYLTFEVEDAGTALPGFAALEPGKAVPGLPGAASFVVAEKGAGERRSAAGEIPYRFRPGERFAFADLSGAAGAFATLDYGDGGAAPTLYLGSEVTLAELGWAGRAPAERPLATVKADRMACPECDGALELRAPDQTQRVGCPYCGTLSAVSEGKLRKLQLLRGTRIPSLLPLGGKGTLRGVEWTVLGHLHKATPVDGVWYDWDEYLLYEPRQGFRWLVVAKGHWSFVEPVPVAEVDEQPLQSARWRDRRFRAFQSGTAYVKQVLGECYWQVEYDEETLTRDYVAPPLMLSREANADELLWSVGTYVPRAEVAKAFGVTLPESEGVAPHQPYPHGRVLRAWALLAAIVTVLALAVFVTRGTRVVLDSHVPIENATAAQPFVFFSEPFALRARRNLEIELYAPVADSWAYLQGDLVNDATGLVQEFDSAVEYYSGVEGGESWSEGKRTEHVFLSALPTGDYSLRLEVQADALRPPEYVRVIVRQGVPRWTHFWLLLAGVSLVPLLVLWHRYYFEKRRWQDSDQGGD